MYKLGEEEVLAEQRLVSVPLIFAEDVQYFENTPYLLHLRCIAQVD